MTPERLAEIEARLCVLEDGDNLDMLEAVCHATDLLAEVRRCHAAIERARAVPEYCGKYLSAVAYNACRTKMLAALDAQGETNE